MPTFRAQVNIPMLSGIPADAITNTWYFQGANTLDSLGPEIEAQLQAFYSGIDDIVLPVEVGPVATLKCYDLDHAEPRQPVHVGTIDLVPNGTEGLPHEVAIVLSFKATVASGEVPARHRGRIFLGPVAMNAMVLSASKPRVSSAARTAIKNAAQALQDAGDNVCQWVIYSPTHHEGRGATAAGSPATPPHSLSESVFNVTEGWVDDAFDTIRSRGEKPSTRTTWT